MTPPTNQRDAQGNRHGVWEHYQLDGRMWFIGRYIHGAPRGLWEEYMADGQYIKKSITLESNDSSN